MAFRPNEGDAEHAIGAQGVIEHLAKARLEDVEGKERVREKGDPGKGHHRHGGWKWDGMGHGRRESLYNIRVPDTAELAER